MIVNMEPFFLDTSKLTKRQIVVVQERLFELGYRWFDGHGHHVRRFGMKPSVITNICETGEIRSNMRYSLDPDYKPTSYESRHTITI